MLDDISEMQAIIKQQAARIAMRDKTIESLRELVAIKDERILMMEEITEKNRMRTLDAQEEYRHA